MPSNLTTVSGFTVTADPAALIVASECGGVRTKSSGKSAEEGGAEFPFSSTPPVVWRMAAVESSAINDSGRIAIIPTQTRFRHLCKRMPTPSRTTCCCELNLQFTGPLLPCMVTRGPLEVPGIFREGWMYRLNACEVDVPLLDIGAEELCPQLVSHVEALLALSEKSFNGRLEDANKSAMRSDPGDDCVKDFADSVLQGYSSQPFCHLSLDYSGSIFF